MALIDSLISYWKLDEASGDAADAHGSNTLTDHATQGGVTGKINNGRDFELASSDFLEHADNTDLSTGDIDFTLQAWVNMESLPGSGGVYGVIGKWTSPSFEYSLYCFNNSGTIRFYWDVRRAGGGLTYEVVANNFGAPSSGTWYLLHAWHDSVNNLIGISVNAGTADTLANSEGANDATADFEIGRYDGANFFDGIIDEVGFWKRVLTSGERTSLYNGGAGLAYSSFGAAAAGGPLTSGGSLTKGVLIRGGRLVGA